jgi:prolyl-tRNA synthetase
MGGRDLENNTMEVMRRDTLEKETRSCDGIEEYVQQLLEDIQNNIYQKALNYRNEHIVKVDSYDDFKEQIEKGGLFWLIGMEPRKRKTGLKRIPRQQFVVFLLMLMKRA